LKNQGKGPKKPRAGAKVKKKVNGKLFKQTKTIPKRNVRKNARKRKL
jgi:hypothetical protein